MAFIVTIYRGNESYAHALSHRRICQRHKILLPKPAAQTGTVYRCLTHYINRFCHSKVFVITVLILIFKVSIKALKEKSLPKSHRMLSFSIYRIKVKRQKEKCQFFFVHLIFKLISSFKLK